MFSSKNKRGFTLIELIVVMIIIGILVLLATPRFINYIKLARYTNIVHDIKVTEDVLTAHIARKGDKAYKMPDDAIKVDLFQVLDGESYIKEGLLNLTDHNSNYKKVVINQDGVGYIANLSYKTLEKVQPFYLLSDEYMKVETRTRLKGEFFATEEGLVIYNGGGESTNPDYSVDPDDELMGYFTSPDKGITITGFTEKGQAYYNASQTIPPIPNKTLIVSDNAFENYRFQNDNFDFKNIETIGNNAFPNSMFKGDFNCPNLVSIGDNGFGYSNNDYNKFKVYGANFTGDFNCPKLQYVGDNAFINSVFKGDFNTNNINHIGGFSFYQSIFTGEFDTGNIKSIGDYAFYDSIFIGDFISNNVESIGEFAFFFSKFTGDFRAPKLTSIKTYTFVFSEFTGTFDASNLVYIEPRPFTNSNFTGDFIAPKLLEIGDYAFLESKFDGEFYAPIMKEIGLYSFYKSRFQGEFNNHEFVKIGNYAFRYSNFTGEFNNPNLKILGNYAFCSSQFDGEFKAPLIKIIGNCAFLQSNFTGNQSGNFENPSVEVIGSHAFYRSKFTGSFNCPKVEGIGHSAFYYSKFTGDFKTSEQSNLPYGMEETKKETRGYDIGGTTDSDGNSYRGTIGKYAFMLSEFNGDFIGPHIKTIGTYAFNNSMFEGKFDCPKIEYLETNTFRPSLIKFSSYLPLELKEYIEANKTWPNS